MRHQHVHDVVVIELDLDQHLAAADVVVDEIVTLEVGLERALDLAGGDVEVFGDPCRSVRRTMPLRKLT